MKLLDLYLNKKLVGAVFCDERCNTCRHRFPCFTSRMHSIIVNDPTAEELGRSHSYMEDTIYRFMRCPHCNNIFYISKKQYEQNTKFWCRSCRQYNWGSSEVDEHGILIGEML